MRLSAFVVAIFVVIVAVDAVVIMSLKVGTRQRRQHRESRMNYSGFDCVENSAANDRAKEAEDWVLRKLQVMTSDDDYHDAVHYGGDDY